jgi:hypothetical protein
VGGAERRTWTGGFVVPNGGVAEDIGAAVGDGCAVIVTGAEDALVVARVETTVVVSLVLDGIVVVGGGVDDSDVDSVPVSVVLVGSVVELTVVPSLDDVGSVDSFECRSESSIGLMAPGCSARGTCERVAVLAGSRVTRRTNRHRVTVTMTAAHSRFIALS